MSGVGLAALIAWCATFCFGFGAVAGWTMRGWMVREARGTGKAGSLQSSDD
jgi:hypothetical protein